MNLLLLATVFHPFHLMIHIINEEFFASINNTSNNKPETIPAIKITLKEISFNNTSDKFNNIEPKLNKSHNHP